MPDGWPAQRTDAECEKVRLAFVERPVRPLYSDLAKEFGVPLSTISRWSSEEGWVVQRAAAMEKKVTEGDTLGIILEAAGRVNRPVIAAITNAALLAIQNIAETFHSIDPTKQKSPGTRASIINTLTFALNNIASTCKSVGITGFPKELKELGQTREGGWSPALQQQINVTIQNAVKGEPAKQAEPIPDSVPTT